MQICKLCKSEVAETCLRHLGCKIAQDVSFPPRRAKRDREKGRKKTAKTKWCHLKNNIQNFNLVVESWQQHFLQTRRFNFLNKVKRAYGVIRRHLHNHWTYFSTILIGRRIIRYRLIPIHKIATFEVLVSMSCLSFMIARFECYKRNTDQ